MEHFKFDSETRFFDILVPTTDTTKFGFLAELFFRSRKSVMFAGDTGVGKSVLARTTLNKLSKEDMISVFINFSAQTNSTRTQVCIELRFRPINNGESSSYFLF